MSIIQTVLFSLVLTCLLSCRKQACQNPPPSYSVAFTDMQGQPFANDSLQASALRLADIYSASHTLIPLMKFKPVISSDRYKFIYNVGYDLFSQSGQNQYGVEINSRIVGILSLKSQRDSSKCDGWMHLIEVRFNDQIVKQRTDNVTYVVEVML